MRKSIILCAALLTAISAGAQKKTKFAPPVMGWSSWNTLFVNVSEQNICANADAQVSTGLRDAGYVYCNIDDGYMGGRDAEGNMTANPELFPHGMRYLSDYIRARGLKPGIYNDAAGNTCSCSAFKHPEMGHGVGLHGYEARDCELYFDKWNYDFIKVDYCGALNLQLPEQPTYTAIGRAIQAEEKKLGKKITFNICRGAFLGTWMLDIADSWRIGGDIRPEWESIKYEISRNKYLSAYCGGGHYNDMDMMEIGKGMPLNEEEVHMAMWCIQSSPMLVGCDMTKIPPQSLELMKNREMIAVNQDPLGLQAYIAYQKDNAYIYVKDIKKLYGNTRAVALLNLGDAPATFDVPLETIDMTGIATTRDLIHHTAGPTLKGRIQATVPAHGVAMWTVKGKRIERTVYDAGTAFMPKFNTLGWDPIIIRYADDAAATRGVTARYLGNSPDNVMEWRNVYSRKGGAYEITIRYTTAEPRDLNIRVNGGQATGFLGISSFSDPSHFDTVTHRVMLRKGENTITLGCDNGWAPDIDCITLRKL